MALITSRGARIRGENLTASAFVATDFPIFNQFLRGSDLASFSFLNPGDNAEYYHVTGTTTTSYFGTAFLLDGRTVVLYFVSSLTLTHNGGSPPGGTVPFRLSGGSTIVVPAGSAFIFKYDASLAALVQVGGYVVAAGGGTVNQVHAGTGITVTGTLADPIVNNAGVLSVSAGTAITVTGTAANPIVNNAGVTSVTAGSGGIVISGPAATPVVNLPPQPNEQVLFSNGVLITSSASMKYNASKGLYLANRIQDAFVTASVVGGTLTFGAGNTNTYAPSTPTTITGFATANWQGGARVTLNISGVASLTLKHFVTPGGGAAPLLLSGGADVTVTFGTFDFYYDPFLGAWVQVNNTPRFVGTLQMGGSIVQGVGGAGLGTLTAPIWMGLGRDEVNTGLLEWSINEFVNAGATRCMARLHFEAVDMNVGGNLIFELTCAGVPFASSGDIHSPGPTAYWIPSSTVPAALPGPDNNIGLRVRAGTGFTIGNQLYARATVAFYQ